MKRWFGDLAIGWKLRLSFLLIGGFMLIAGFVIIMGMLSLRESLRIVYEDYTIAGTQLAHVANNLTRHRDTVRQARFASERGEFERFVDGAAKLKTDIHEPLNVYAATTLRISQGGRNETHDLQVFRQGLEDYFNAVDQLLSSDRERWERGEKPEILNPRARLLIKQVSE